VERGRHPHNGLSARFRHLQNSSASGTISATRKRAGGATNTPAPATGGKS
jgi:hypothetical protein